MFSKIERSRFLFMVLAVIPMRISSLFRVNMMRPLTIGLASQVAYLSYTNSRVNCESVGKSTHVNPLLQQQSLPRFREIAPADVVPAIQHDISQLKKDFSAYSEKLEHKKHASHSGQAAYSSVVEELEKIQAPLGYSWGVVGHLMGVKNSDELRKAHESLQPAVIETYQTLGQSVPLFNALSDLKHKISSWKSLDEAQQRIINSNILQMKSSGVDLDPVKKEKFNKLQLENAELSTKFSNNVLDSTKKFKLLLASASEIEGLPNSAKGLAAQTAVAQGHKDATAENGPWVVTLDGPSYIPCMQHLRNREIREKLYRAFVTRASEGEHDNAPIISKILQNKVEMAKLLGYNCHAEKSLASKMAHDVDAVMNLIHMLREKSLPAAQKDLQQLQEYAKSQGFTDTLKLWDVPFWSERLREAKYEYKDEELRPYFALPNVLSGLFSLANRLFGITIVEATKEAQVWHEDVQFFKVFDEQTGEHIASFYLDPFSRPAEKRGGAWMDVCVGRSKVLGKKPVAYLTCNGSPPVGNKPSLMSFSEVETLFHEFGHGLQHMLTAIEHSEAAGINNVEWDAVELPSQFMENWCFDKKTLYSFAKHYETGEPLPEELFNKVKAAKNFNAGLQMMRQLFFGATDMYLHSQAYDPYGKLSPFDVQKQLATLYTVMPLLPEDRFLCSFSHIFAGGYSAGYYSYKWAEVMSADAFGAFEDAGLDNEEAVRTTGRRFRNTVLAMGGGKHPSDVFKAFRGRDPSPTALLRHSGLI